MITDFPINPLTNLSGMQSFSFSPMENISSLPAVLNSVTNGGVVFKPGKTFLKGYATVDTLQFTEDATDDDNGSIYHWQVDGYYSGEGPAVLEIFRSLKACKQLVVLTKDYNGILRLVGWNYPLQFDYTYGSGKVTGNDPRGYTFKFYALAGMPAPVYVP